MGQIWLEHPNGSTQTRLGLPAEAPTNWRWIADFGCLQAPGGPNPPMQAMTPGIHHRFIGTSSGKHDLARHWVSLQASFWHKGESGLT